MAKKSVKKTKKEECGLVNVSMHDSLALADRDFLDNNMGDNEGWVQVSKELPPSNVCVLVAVECEMGIVYSSACLDRSRGWNLHDNSLTIHADSDAAIVAWQTFRPYKK